MTRTERCEDIRNGNHLKHSNSIELGCFLFCPPLDKRKDEI